MLSTGGGAFLSIFSERRKRECFGRIVCDGDKEQKGMCVGCAKGNDAFDVCA